MKFRKECMNRQKGDLMENKVNLYDKKYFVSYIKQSTTTTSFQIPLNFERISHNPKDQNKTQYTMLQDNLAVIESTCAK